MRSPLTLTFSSHTYRILFAGLCAFCEPKRGDGESADSDDKSYSIFQSSKSFGVHSSNNNNNRNAMGLDTLVPSPGGGEGEEWICFPYCTSSSCHVYLIPLVMVVVAAK